MSKWKEIETPKGILKYRFPNCAEGYDFLAAIEKIGCAQDVFRIKGSFARMMGPMIDYSSMGYASYDEFLEDRENNMVHMAQIADDVFVEITKTLGKKTSSPTQSTQLPEASPRRSLLSLLKVMKAKENKKPN